MSKRKLLLADDSVTIQKVVNLTFADEGIEVISVGDGDSAMEKVAEIAPDLIMADVNMPGLTGYEICERIRRDEALSHTPVILLVGSFEPFDEMEARRVGADDYLTKPFQSIRQLVNKVTVLLESYNNENGDVSAPKEPSSLDDTLEMDKGNLAAETHPNDYSDNIYDDEMIQTNRPSSYNFDETQKFESRETGQLAEIPSYGYSEPLQEEKSEYALDHQTAEPESYSYYTPPVIPETYQTAKEEISEAYETNEILEKPHPVKEEAETDAPVVSDNYSYQTEPATEISDKSEVEVAPEAEKNFEIAKEEFAAPEIGEKVTTETHQEDDLLETKHIEDSSAVEESQAAFARETDETYSNYSEEADEAYEIDGDVTSSASYDYKEDEPIRQVAEEDEYSAYKTISYEIKEDDAVLEKADEEPATDTKEYAFVADEATSVYRYSEVVPEPEGTEKDEISDELETKEEVSDELEAKEEIPDDLEAKEEVADELEAKEEISEIKDDESEPETVEARAEKVESEISTEDADDNISETEPVKEEIESTETEKTVEEPAEEDDSVTVEDQPQTGEEETEPIKSISEDVVEEKTIAPTTAISEEEIPLPEYVSVLETEDDDILQLPPIALEESPAAETHLTHSAPAALVSSAELQNEADSLQISPDLIELIVAKVMERLSDKAVKEVAWEVVPQMTEVIVKKIAEEKLKD